MFDLEKFKTGMYYVHLPTKETYDDAMKYLNENGFKWVNGDDLKSIDRWWVYNKNTCIMPSSWDLDGKRIRYGRKYVFERAQLKELEINATNTEDNLNNSEKMKRDLIKLLFEKEFSKYELEGMYDYRGKVITDYMHRTVKFVDFLNKMKDEYGIKSHEVSEVIIEEFDLKEYKEEK